MSSKRIKQIVPFCDLATQYDRLKPGIDAAINSVIRSSQFINGEKVQEFERSFAALHGGATVLSVASGTDALNIAVQAYGFGAGDEIISVPNTWISTINAITLAGATPVLIDIDPDTYQIDPRALEAAITVRTKAIIPVHMFGHPAPIDELQEIIGNRDIKVIEDVAQSPLAKINGKTVGTFGGLACFSFYPSKNLGCYGDGGAILVNDQTLVEKVKMLKNYGQPERFRHDVIGYNSRLDTLQAGVLLEKLKWLQAWTTQRQKLAARFDEKLSGLPVKIPASKPNCDPVHHLYVVQLEGRDLCLEYLKENGVLAQIHYPTPVHFQPCYSYLGYKKGDFPVTEALCERGLSLPFFPEMTDRQIDYVVDTLASFFSGVNRYAS